MLPTTTTTLGPTSTTSTTIVGAGGQGDIFGTDFRNCSVLRVGYNRFPNGTVVNWRIDQTGTGTLTKGTFTAIGGGKLGSKTYHFLSIPLGLVLNGSKAFHTHVRYYWTINGVTTNFEADRGPGC